MSKTITEMTIPQLREYAKEKHGVEYPSSYTKAEILEKIAQLPGEESLQLAPVGAGNATDGNEDKIPKSVTIQIPDDGVSATYNYETVYVDGRSYQIKKGVDATVPYSVYDVLNNAIEDFLQPIRQQDGRITHEMRKRRRIPFSVIKMNY